MQRLRRTFATLALVAVLGAMNMALGSTTAIQACEPQGGRGGIVDGPWEVYPACSTGSCMEAECFCGADPYDRACEPYRICAGSSCS